MMLNTDEAKLACNIMKQGLKVLIDTPQADDAISSYVTLRDKLNAPEPIEPAADTTVDNSNDSRDD